MRRILPLTLALAVALALTLAACDGDGDGGDQPTATATATTSGAGETPTPTPLPEDVCAPNPDPATPEFQVLDAPSANASVSSPVTISGQVLSFENNYQVKIYDADGTVIAETFGTAEGIEIGELAPFSQDVPFEVEAPTPACIWVYEASAMDGSPTHVGQIPVLLQP